MGRMHPHVGIHRDDKRPDIESRALPRGDPVLVDLHQLFDSLHSERLVDQRDTETVVGQIEPRHVFLRPEQYDPSLRRAVGLHAFEDLLAVVQAHGGRIEGERAVGNDPGIVPALSLIVIHQKHVVGEDGAKPQLVGGGRFRLRGFGFFHADFLHGATLPIIGFYKEPFEVRSLPGTEDAVPFSDYTAGEDKLQDGEDAPSEKRGIRGPLDEKGPYPSRVSV